MRVSLIACLALGLSVCGTEAKKKKEEPAEAGASCAAFEEEIETCKTEVKRLQDAILGSDDRLQYCVELEVNHEKLKEQATADRKALRNLSEELTSLGHAEAECQARLEEATKTLQADTGKASDAMQAASTCQDELGRMGAKLKEMESRLTESAGAEDAAGQAQEEVVKVRALQAAAVTKAEQAEGEKAKLEAANSKLDAALAKAKADISALNEKIKSSPKSAPKAPLTMYTILDDVVELAKDTRDGYRQAISEVWEAGAVQRANAMKAADPIIDAAKKFAEMVQPVWVAVMEATEPVRIQVRDVLAEVSAQAKAAAQEAWGEAQPEIAAVWRATVKAYMDLYKDCEKGLSNTPVKPYAPKVVKFLFIAVWALLLLIITKPILSVLLFAVRLVLRFAIWLVLLPLRLIWGILSYPFRGKKVSEGKKNGGRQKKKRE